MSETKEKKIVNIQGYDFDLAAKKMNKTHFLTAFGKKRKSSKDSKKELPALMPSPERGWEAYERLVIGKEDKK